MQRATLDKSGLEAASHLQGRIARVFSSNSLVNTMDMTAAIQYILTAAQSLRPGETGQHCLPNTIVCFCVISYGQSTHVAIWTRTKMFG